MLAPWAPTVMLRAACGQSGALPAEGGSTAPAPKGASANPGHEPVALLPPRRGHFLHPRRGVVVILQMQRTHDQPMHAPQTDDDKQL